MNFVLSYSCGKDSTLALYRLIKEGHNPVGLIVTVNKDENKSWFHGIPNEILEVFYDNRKSFYEWQPECGKGYILSIKFTEKGFKINNIKDIY